MALIKRETPQEPKITQSANTERNVQITNNNITPKKKVLTAQDRKNIKVTPESFSKIKTICTMKSMKNYEFIDEILEFYIANNLTEREQRILKNITSNNK
ncbi:MULTISPECIES: hypothetical protein [Bacillus]|uniref:hypothetical protein n=1 Tax=Bacillus TaxID=1386 RepID=UPI0005394633|nr:MULTISPECIES: hypothetical protein [Bacillus]MDA1797391.1 hypothetical protein [Bacillus cereus group sp. BY8-1LC]MDA1882797.1 hypothetical protein [Bacillus cereus group sp. BY10-2LC]MDA2667131.1 hypothetical protein [Bacillus cereus group sp. Bc032]MDA2688777.1 hypothetical protein [Bacillus cereus group sp. Bc030]MDA2749754.1 hypothetical protein [Bacillus cereus group sp. Bc009]